MTSTLGPSTDEHVSIVAESPQQARSSADASAALSTRPRGWTRRRPVMVGRVPIGVLSIGIALRAIGAQTGLMPPVVVPVAASLAALPIAMLSAGLALWLPGRRLLGLQVIEAVRQE